MTIDWYKLLDLAVTIESFPDRQHVYNELFELFINYEVDVAMNNLRTAREVIAEYYRSEYKDISINDLDEEEVERLFSDIPREQ